MSDRVNRTLVLHEIAHAWAAILGSDGVCSRAVIATHPEGGMMMTPVWEGTPSEAAVIRSHLGGLLVTEGLNVEEDRFFASVLPREVMLEHLQWCHTHIMPLLADVDPATLDSMYTTIIEQGGIEVRRSDRH